MNSRAQIEARLREENPSATDDSRARHYPGSPYYEATIQRWTDVEEADPSPSAEPPPRPDARQIRLALIDAGIDLADVAALLAGDPAALVQWEYASHVPRDHPLVEALAAALDLDEQAVGAIFATAMKL